MRSQQQSWGKLTIRGVSLIASMALSLGSISCGDDDDGSGPNGGASGSGGSPPASAGSAGSAGKASTPAGGAGSAASGGSGGKGGSGNGGGGGKGGSGGQSSTAGSTSGGNHSEECVDFCECYETKCSVFVDVPGGKTCLDFCEEFVSIPIIFNCRQGMCGLSDGPEDNNQDHCQHSMGIGQCNGE